jgi:hypothetical protein
MRPPAGVCIQELATRIQNSDIEAPSATMQVASRWMGRGTLCQPNMATPRNPASSMKAIAPSNPSILPKKPPATLVNGAQFVPNSNSRGSPVATPTPKFSRNSRPQKRRW